MIFSSLLIVVIGLFCITHTTNFRSKQNNTALSLSADSLIISYLKNEKIADSLYINKQLEVSGILKEVNFINNRKTIILKTQLAPATIICDLQTTTLETLEKLKQEQHITIEGTCKGFLNDVILLNCNIKLNE